MPSAVACAMIAGTSAALRRVTSTESFSGTISSRVSRARSIGAARPVIARQVRGSNEQQEIDARS